MSCHVLDRSGITTVISNEKCKFYLRKDRNQFLGHVPMRVKDGLFTAEIIKQDGKRVSVNTAWSIKGIKRKALNEEAGEVCHKRLGHGYQKMVTGMLKDARYMMGKNEKQIKQRCTTCVKFKHTKSPAKRNLIEGSENVTIHVDTCSPIRLKCIGGSSYFLTMTVPKHRYTRVKVM